MAAQHHLSPIRARTYNIMIESNTVFVFVFEVVFSCLFYSFRCIIFVLLVLRYLRQDQSSEALVYHLLDLLALIINWVYCTSLCKSLSAVAKTWATTERRKKQALRTSKTQKWENQWLDMEYISCQCQLKSLTF